jgi:hypothetical protein
VAETTAKILLCYGVRRTDKRDGTSASLLVEDISRNKCFSQVRISHILRFISSCDLVTKSPSYLKAWEK